MVLESTVICVDNSEFMRNGDVMPTRLQARAARARCSLPPLRPCPKAQKVTGGVDARAPRRAPDALTPPAAQAQSDAVNLLAGAKTQSNPESCVGILSLAGKVPKMLVTPTPDLGKVLNSMHGMGLDGHVHLATGVQVRTPACR